MKIGLVTQNRTVLYANNFSTLSLISMVLVCSAVVLYSNMIVAEPEWIRRILRFIKNNPRMERSIYKVPITESL